jgi:hypothetical protein
MDVLFTDAQAMATMYPATFEAPTTAELASIQPGSLVKICAREAERFWVQVTTRTGNHLSGRVDNDLVYTERHGLTLGDTVTFETRHVYAVWQDN